MKKNLRKAFCVMTAVMMLATSVTACGSKKAEETTTAETTTAAETTKEETTAAETTKEETTAAETTKEETTTAAEASKEETTAEADKADAAASELTEEEQAYVDKIEVLTNEMTETMNNLQTELAALEPDDIDGAKEIIEKAKVPFQGFIELEAPETFADAQAKFKSGSEAMIEYLDITMEMMDATVGGKQLSEGDAAKYTERMTAAMTTMSEDLTAGATLMAEAAMKKAE